MSVSREMVLSRARRTLDELPGLVWPKCTASQWWQVCLVWIKQGGSTTWIGALEKLKLKPPKVRSHENTRTPDTVHWTDTYRVESGSSRINAQWNGRKTSNQTTPKQIDTLHLDEHNKAQTKQDNLQSLQVSHTSHSTHRSVSHVRIVSEEYGHAVVDTKQVWSKQKTRQTKTRHHKP